MDKNTPVRMYHDEPVRCNVCGWWTLPTGSCTTCEDLRPGLASDAMFLDRYSLVRVLNFLADHHPDVIGEIIAATATEAES